MTGLDAIDRRMLAALRSDGRISNADLAGAVGLSPSACLRRLRLLERSGVIRGYTALIDEGGPGAATVVIVQITLDRQTDEAFDRFEAALRQVPEVREAYLMTGVADYLVRVEASGPSDYERIHKERLSRLPGVARLLSNFAIRTVVSGGE